MAGTFLTIGAVLHSERVFFFAVLQRHTVFVRMNVVRTGNVAIYGFSVELFRFAPVGPIFAASTEFVWIRIAPAHGLAPFSVG